MSPVSVLRRLKQGPPAGFQSHLDYLRVKRLPALTPGETRLYGEATRFTDRDGLLHSVREIFYDEVYKFRARSEAPHIIDAGANIGLSVRYFKQLYPRASIIAYEPDPAIFSMLQANVADLPGVELRQCAAWVEDTTLTFFIEGSLAGSTEIDYMGRGQPIEITAERLKDELRKRPVDFLKIDIEGAENAVLFDIADELDQVDHLFFEYHSVPGKEQRLSALLELVTAKGFRYAINGAHCARWPFIETTNHGFDLQLNVSCVRR